jgi:hypothetical protein
VPAELLAQPRAGDALQAVRVTVAQPAKALRVLRLQLGLVQRGVQQQRVGLHPRFGDPQRLDPPPVVQQVLAVDQHPPAVAGRGLHVHVEHQTPAEVGGGHVEGLVLDAGIGPQQGKAVAPHHHADQRVDTGGVVGVHDDVHVVPDPVGDVLVVAEDQPPDRRTVQLGGEVDDERRHPVWRGRPLDIAQGAQWIDLSHGSPPW